MRPARTWVIGTVLATLLAMPMALAGILDGQRKTDFLPVEQAFQLQGIANDEVVTLRFTVAPEHYLYRHAFKFELPEGSAARIGPPKLPDGNKETDDYFGEIETYRGFLEITLAVQGGVTPAALDVEYQGCADAGLCYPPQRQRVDLSGGAASAESQPGFQSQQDRLAAQLAGDNRALVILSFLGLGLLLALTPCVLPMIPIVSGMIVGAQAGRQRAFWLSSVYVLAMAAAYTVFGVLAGLFGANLQAALQSPWVLVPFALLFALLALAMFGLFNLAMPAGLQQRLTEIGRGRSGIAGAALLGFTSALIVGPCLAPPLAGALLYIGSSGDAVLGGLALFALGLGMGLPLIVLAVAGAGLLPRAGHWMRQVNVLFGMVLLGVGLWLLERVLPASVSLTLWSLLAAGYAVYLLRQPGAVVFRLAGTLLALYALVLAAGALLGGQSALSPLPSQWLRGEPASRAADSPFTRVSDIASLERALARAKEQNKPVVLDFYADWCVECVHMEHQVFGRPAVQNVLDAWAALQVDVTDYNADDRAIMQRLGVIGPPTILFFGADGQERRAYRVVGEMNADEFTAHLEKAVPQ